MERHQEIKNFRPEKFWSIKLTVNRNNQESGKNEVCQFNWQRNKLFDELATQVLLDNCIDARFAKVTSVLKKQTKKLRPEPLNTIEA